MAFNPLIFSGFVTNSPSGGGGGGSLVIGTTPVTGGTPESILKIDSLGNLGQIGPLTDGQLIIGVTGGPAVTATLAGTLNQINITNGSGSILLSLPQDIDSSSSPTFNGLTINGLTADTVLYLNPSNQLASSVVNSTELSYVSGVTSSIQTQIDTINLSSYKTEKFTLDNTDITNKFITLSASPITPGNVVLNIIGGVIQDYSVDYTISTNQLNWDSLGLDGILTSGDKLIVQYN